MRQPLGSRDHACHRRSGREVESRRVAGRRSPRPALPAQGSGGRADDLAHMDIGLTIAAQGMLAEQVRQNELSNDLANGSTPGYKPQLSEQQSFDSLLLQNTANGQTIGSIDTGVDIAKTVTDTASAPLEQTGQALDFGIAGQGFFAVRTAQGVRYTQNGQFGLNDNSQLVDSN